MLDHFMEARPTFRSIYSKAIEPYS